MILLSILSVASIWVFSNAQQACSPVVQNINPNELPKINTQFQARIDILSVESKRVAETFIKYDSDNNLAQIVYKENNSTFSETFDYFDNQVYVRRNGLCSVKRLNDSFESQFLGAILDEFGNYKIRPPNDFLLWNNGVPHRKLEPTVYRGIPANHFQSCQTLDKPVRASFLVDYYFKTTDYNSPVDLPGFDNYREIPLGFTARGVELDTNNPFNREYNFYEFKNYIEYRQDFISEREGEYCENQQVKLPIPELPNHFAFVYQSMALTVVETSKFYYSLDWKAARDDYDLPFAEFKEPIKIVHDFNSGIDYFINKARKNCTVRSLSTNANSFINVATLDDKKFVTIKDPKNLFGIDESFYFAGNRYERGIKSSVYVSKKKLDPSSSDTSPNNELIEELFFSKVQEAAFEGLDQLEDAWPISMHLYQSLKPEPIIFNVYDFDSKLKRISFDISPCFDEKDIIRFGIRFNYPEGLSEEKFDRQFGRKLEEAFDQVVFKAIQVFNASPLRLIVPTFIAYDRYFVIASGLTDHAEPIYQFSRSQKRKIKSGGNVIIVDSPESCARACVYQTIYSQSPDPKCYSFDFYTTPSGPRCTIFPFTRYTNPSIEEEDQIIDHYTKIVETFDSADEKALYSLLQETVARKEFSISAKNSSGVELTFTASEIFETRLNENGNNGGFTSFFEQFLLVGQDKDFNREELAKRPTLILRERFGVSIDECARLCLAEPAFVCELMTYGKANQECKWTSLPSIYDFDSEETRQLFKILETFDVFERDPFFNYIKYPFQVTSTVGLSSEPVKDARQCALKCNNAKDLRCRSFNYCRGKDQFYCILSELNINNNEYDPQIVDSPLCDHYSKYALSDYQLVQGQTLGVNPESTVRRDTVEGCAELCSFEDKFFCRSFDYNLETFSCRFFRENLVDASLIDLKIQQAPQINHYSRQYYIENGALKKIEPTNLKSSVGYSGGVIFGIVLCVIIGGFLFGIMSTFVYFKLTQKSNLLPVMRFTNPNYHQQVE